MGLSYIEPLGHVSNTALHPLLDQNTPGVEYFTHKEELAKETEWLGDRKEAKKRKLNTSLSQNMSQNKEQGSNQAPP